MTDGSRETYFQFAGLRITLGDLIKVILALITVIAAWTSLRSQLDSLSVRLDSDEKQTNIYLRSDVQAIRDTALIEEIQSLQANLSQRLDRIERKLDSK